MVLPALQVRVPQPANALLQAEQIKGARAQNQALQQQAAGRNALLSLTNQFEGLPQGAAERQQFVNQFAQSDPLGAINLQQHFSQASAREAQTVARAFVNVRDQATFDQAKAGLNRAGVSTTAMPDVFDAGYVQSAVNIARTLESQTVSAGTQAQIEAGDRRASLPTPPLSVARQAQELAQIAARGSAASGGAAGFTLSPGQSRFDAAGNPIANVPAAAADAKTVVLSPGSRVVNTQNGQTIAENPAAAPTPSRPVTLSPGQALVDTAGNVITSVPAGPERPVALSPGQSLVTPQGQPVTSVPAGAGPGFSLTPGGTRFDAAGNPIASVPPTPPTPTQRQADIAALRARGFSQQQAQDIAAGRVRVSTDPVTGNTTLVNVATGAAAPVTPTQGPVITSEERGRILNQNASIERVLGLSEGLPESAAAGTGPRAALGTLVNSLAGLAGRDAPIPADEIAAARQDMRLFNQIAKTAIVNNPRFPVAEQQIVERMLPDPNAFFANPSVEFNKVLQLQEFLRSLQIENNQSLGNAPAPVGTQEGSTATNPTTGERVIFRNGAWEPL